MTYVGVRLDETPESLEKFNWHLSDGWKIVDRFEFPTFAIVMWAKQQ